ncbi:MAG: Lrp/AsnC family transcriptional regulator [Euryarchaeota archaeon]|nr:Lrp/AsnC family transcriptional regulator [Euryarchaeota archaeon]
MKEKAQDLRQRWKGLDPDLLPVDDTDMGILSMLVANSRETYSDMASALHITEATVRRRVRALTDRGLILGFTTRINFAAIENTVRAFIHLSVAPGRLKSVVEHLRAHQRILEVNRVSGQRNILVIARFVSIAELQDFVDDFLRIDGVTDTEVQIVMGSHKEAPWGGA